METAKCRWCQVSRQHGVTYLFSLAGLTNSWWSAFGNHKAETTKCRRCQVSGRHGVTFSHDSEQLVPLVSKKFRAIAVSLTSLMIAPSRRERLRLTDEQSSKTSGRRRERLADAHGSVTSRPPETKRPATTPPEGPSVATCRDVSVPATGHLACLSHSRLSRLTPA